MKFIQITDLHVGDENEDTHGVDVRTNFLNVLHRVKREDPDLLVVSGDLCFREPRERTHRWVEEKLGDLPFPSLIIPGNHDNNQWISYDFLPAHPDLDGHRYCIMDFPGWRLIFLDTHSGVMSDAQFKWLEEEINTAPANFLIFMHHPPVFAGVPYMDENHSFKQSDRFFDVVKNCRKIFNVFCGHYHVDKVIQLEALNVFITPSCFFQIRQDIDEFGIDHYQTAYRVINVDDLGMMHTIKYMTGQMIDSPLDF